MEFLGKTFEIGLWSGEKLKDLIAVDTETTMITCEGETPTLVTMQVYDGTDRIYFVDLPDVSRFLEMHKSCTFIFHNAPFDIDVLKRKSPEWNEFAMIDDQRILDVGVLYRLVHLAEQGFSPQRWNLAKITKEYLDIELSKDESIRCNFGDYLVQGGVYWDYIPDESLEYAARDAVVTFKLWNLLEIRAVLSGSQTLLTHGIQVAGHLALSRITKRGIGFDVEARTKMVDELKQLLTYHADILATYGWVRGSKGINERYAYIMTDILGLKLPKTEDGSLSSKADDLEKYKDVTFVKHYLAFQEIEHKLQYIEPLTEQRIHPRYDFLKNTGRTGASKPNIQNPPREGGIRELFIPNKDHVFMVIDYSFIELCTLAQTCLMQFGYSKLADTINAGIDPHRYFAAQIANKKPEEVTKDERQGAKAANFGFPGGLGVDTFRTYAKLTYGVNFSGKEAKKLRDFWFRAFPEMRKYMQAPEGDTWSITGRKRTNASFCASKNTPFQGLAADGAKLAMYELEKAGFKAVAFVHDELIIEHPISDNLDIDFKNACDIMVSAMRQVTPDVTVKVEGHILKRWEKK